MTSRIFILSDESMLKGVRRGPLDISLPPGGFNAGGLQAVAGADRREKATATQFAAGYCFVQYCTPQLSVVSTVYIFGTKRGDLQSVSKRASSLTRVVKYHSFQLF